MIAILQNSIMRKSVLVIFLVAACLLSGGECSLCQAKTQIKGLFQDSITLRLDKSYLRHSYSYTMQGIEQPRMALSFDRLEVKSLKRVEYQIATMFASSSSINFILIFNPAYAKWRQLRLILWVIGAQVSDMATGYALFDNINSMGTKRIIFSERDEPLLTKINQGLLSDPKVFVSSILGLSAFTSDVLDIKAQGVVHKMVGQSPKYWLEFSATSGAQTFIKLIRFCYILYAPSRLQNSKSHFGIVSSSVPASGPTRLLLKQALVIFPIRYHMVGITALQLSSQSDPISLEVTLQAGNLEYLELSSSSPLPRIEINYLIVGTDMMMSCINCEDSFVALRQEGTICVNRKQCAADEIEAVDKDGIYYSCRKCIADSTVMVSSEGKKYCGCSTGYVSEPNGSCKKMQVYKSIVECTDLNSMRDPVTGRCICKEGYSLDDFGFCGGCNQTTSYWDLNTQKCICLPGFSYDDRTASCLDASKTCGLYQVYGASGCQCEQFTVRKEKTGGGFECAQCPTGRYKVEGANDCGNCPTACKQCISEQFCLVCSIGYFFKDFTCVSRCGDGFKAGTEQCDDGNYDLADGCSEKCNIEDGFVCKEDQNKKSICSLKVPAVSTNSPSQTGTTGNINNNGWELTPITQTENLRTNPSNPTQNNQIDKSAMTIKNTTEPVTQHTPQAQVQSTTVFNSTASSSIPSPATVDPSLYKLSVSKSSPVYLSSGIVLELLVKPELKRTQAQINSMFRIDVSDKRALPPAIYYSQDAKKLSSVRCYMHYNNQLPAFDFSIKVWAMFGDGIYKTLTLYSKATGKLSRSIQPVDDESFLL